MNLPELDTLKSEGTCVVCKQPAKHVCKNCEGAAYCTPEHQKSHWSQHKDQCTTYKVLHDEKLGRYGVAARTLDAGEVILTELPVIVGPKPDTYPMCLGCYAPVDCSVMCSTCGWPVCSAACEVLPCHAKAECVIFSSAKVQFQKVDDVSEACPQFNCISPLRLLLAKESNPERWEKEVKFMEAHEERKQTTVWENNQINVVNFLRKACKLEDRFDEDLIHRACGILEVNSFEVRCANGSAVQGLYPQTAIMSHCCVPNTSHSIAPTAEVPEEEYRLTLRTTVRVEKGAQLHTTYTHTLLPTLLRRENLRETKYFNCTCSRCADPTELGTHMSSLKCNKCDPGLVLSTDPLDPNAQWKCTHCEFCTRGEAVRRVYAVIENEIDQLDYMQPSGEAIERREQLWRKYRSVLHPKHAFLTSLRVALSQLYGRAEGYTNEDLPDILLERKIDICRDLLAVADVVEPGLSRLRGMTMYELHAPLVLLARSLYRYDQVDDAKLRQRLEEAESYLSESIRILSLEHPSSTEGMIAAAAQTSLEQLRTSINSLPKA